MKNACKSMLTARRSRLTQPLCSFRRSSWRTSLVALLAVSQGGLALGQGPEFGYPMSGRRVMPADLEPVRDSGMGPVSYAAPAEYIRDGMPLRGLPMTAEGMPAGYGLTPAQYSGPQYAGSQYSGVQYMGGMPTDGMRQVSVTKLPAQEAALSTPEKKPLPPQIAKLPEVQEELQVIHHRSQLLVARDRILRTAVADSSVIEVVRYTENEIDIIGMATGSTTLSIWFENDPDPLIYLITVIRDPSLEEQKRIDYGKLERKLRVLFPNSRVYLIPMSYKIIVKGQARDAEEASKILEVIRGEVINQNGTLPGPQPAAVAVTTAGGAGVGVAAGGYDLASSFIVDMLTVPGERQLMIHVQVAELDRAQLRRMGVNLGVIINGGQQVLNSFSGGGGGNVTGILGNGEVTALCNWLAANGTGKILSQPSLAVLSGHSASFLSGGEFAVPTIVGVDGVGGQQTTFRGYGTSLIVTPTLVDKDLIRMRIIPEFSQLDQANAVGGIPGLNSRRVQTTVELREGQTVAIAGLIGRKTSAEVARIPLLGDLPLIGPTLFANKRATEDENELLVLVTPEIIRPMDADEVPPVPGYYVTPPGDHELYCHGMTEGAPDLGVYQVGPIGRGATYGREVGYHVFEPAPATPLYSPSTPYPQGNVAPLPAPPTTGNPNAGYGAGSQGMYQGPSNYGNMPSGNYGGMPSGNYGNMPPVPPSPSYPPAAPPAELGPSRNYGNPGMNGSGMNGPGMDGPSMNGSGMNGSGMNGPGMGPNMNGPMSSSGLQQRLPSPAFESPNAKRSLTDRLSNILPTGYQESGARPMMITPAPSGQSGGYRSGSYAAPPARQSKPNW